MSEEFQGAQDQVTDDAPALRRAVDNGLRRTPDTPMLAVYNAAIRPRRDGKPGVEIDLTGRPSVTAFEGCIFHRAGVTDGDIAFGDGRLIERVTGDAEPRTDAPLLIRVSEEGDA